MTRWATRLVLPLILLGATALAAYSGFRADRNSERERANAASVRSVAAVQSLTDGLSNRLQDVAGLFNASDSVSASQFKLYTRPVVTSSQASAIGWAQVVQDKDRARFERAHHFKIWTVTASGRRIVAPKRSRYVVPTYVETTEGRKRILGLDFNEDAARKRALIAAASVGNPVATPPVKLSNGSLGISLYMPVYGSVNGKTFDGPRGYTIGAFNFDDFATTLRNRLADTSGLALTFKGKPLVAIGDRDSGTATVTQNLDIAGQTWVLRTWVAGEGYPLGWIFLIAGLLLTILITLTTNLLLRSNHNARELAEARQHEQELMLATHERKSAVAEQLFAQIFDSATIGMALMGHEGRYTKVNGSFCRLLAREESDLVGLRPRDITHPDDIASAEHSVEEMFTDTQVEFEQDKRYIDGEGNVVWVALRARALLDPDGKTEMILVQALDISARRKQEETLRYMADHDGLTGLPNRGAFGAALGQQVSLIRRYGPDGAVMLLDLDNFKEVNDVHGHSAGDGVLRRVADVICEQLRDSDFAGRIGGDEFAVMLRKGSVADATVVAERLVKAIAAMGREYAHDGVPDVTCSVGIAMLQPSTSSVQAIIEQADAAMYEAKAKGRNCFVVSADGIAETTHAPSH